jgi:double-stranded uracil-DNA glycosylase
VSQPSGPLPDILAPGLEVLFVGFNPGLRSAASGHNFAGRGNQFWRLLADAGLTPRLLRPEEDRLVPGWGVGITNLVARPTASAAELARAELRAGVPRLRALVGELRPRFVAYAGKGVYLAAAGLDRAPWGAQPGEGVMAPALDFVLPSPSGLARLRYAEKLRWYKALAEALGR